MMRRILPTLACFLASVSLAACGLVTSTNRSVFGSSVSLGPLPHLMALAKTSGRAVTDPWCMKLAALHLKRMIETDEDMDKTLVTASPEDLERANAILEEPIQATS